MALSYSAPSIGCRRPHQSLTAPRSGRLASPCIPESSVGSYALLWPLPRRLLASRRPARVTDRCARWGAMERCGHGSGCTWHRLRAGTLMRRVLG